MSDGHYISIKLWGEKEKEGAKGGSRVEERREGKKKKNPLPEVKMLYYFTKA